MKAKLSLLVNLQPRSEFVLERLPAVVGRSDEAQVTLSDRWVSRLHCEIAESTEGLVVKDLGSKHGTFVNDHRVSEAVLRPGDLLTVGMSALRVAYEPHPSLVVLAQESERAQVG